MVKTGMVKTGMVKTGMVKTGMVKTGMMNQGSGHALPWSDSDPDHFPKEHRQAVGDDDGSGNRR
jgi:hypothetical protein